MNGRLTTVGQEKPLKWNTEKLSSLQEVSKKNLETVSELKAASKATQCEYPTFSSSPTAPLYPLLHYLIYSSFLLPLFFLVDGKQGFCENNLPG